LNKLRKLEGYLSADRCGGDTGPEDEVIGDGDDRTDSYQHRPEWKDQRYHR
jgi:hypothetical protein